MGKTLRSSIHIAYGLGLVLFSLWMTPLESYAHFSGSGDSVPSVMETTVHFVQSQIAVNEGDGEITVEVRLDGPITSPLTLQVAFQSNLSSASAEDFDGALSHSLRFEPGSVAGTIQSVTFRLRDDTGFEGEEHATFVLKELRSEDEVSVGSPAVLRLSIADNDRAGVVLNEIQPATRHDVDGDGRIAGGGEAFIELFNTENEEVDLSGWTVATGSGSRYRFPGGTVLPGSSAVVLFNTSRPSGYFGGSLVIGVPDLTIDGNSDTVTLTDGDGNRIDSYSYRGHGGRESSLVRNPEGTGTFTGHPAAGRVPHSPGVRSDGTYFSSSLAVSGKSGWHLLASPTPNLPLSGLQGFAPVRGFQGYDPLSPKTLYTGYDGRVFTAPDRLSGTFQPGRGFLVYVESGEERTAAPSVLTPGQAGAGIVTRNTTVELHSSGDGWNLLGNPFGAPVNLEDLLQWVRGGELGSSVAQIWDARANTFRLSTTTGGRLEAWQGFFIQNRNASTLEFPESARMEPGTRSALTGAGNRFLSFTLHGRDREGAVTEDRAAVLSFSDGASHAWDPYDAPKLRPLTDSWALFSIVGQREGRSVYKAQDSRPRDLEGGLSIPMGVRSRGVSGTMELRWDLNELPENWELTLTDRMNGREIDLRSRDSYSFEHSGESVPVRTEEELVRMPELELPQPQAGSPPRFMLSVRVPIARETVADTPESVRLNPMYPNPFSTSTTIPFELSEDAHVRLRVWNTIGRIVATIVDGPMSAGEHEVTWTPGNDIPQGIFHIQLEVDGKVLTRQVTYITQ